MRSAPDPLRRLAALQQRLPPGGGTAQVADGDDLADPTQYAGWVDQPGRLGHPPETPDVLDDAEWSWDADVTAQVQVGQPESRGHVDHRGTGRARLLIEGQGRHRLPEPAPVPSPVGGWIPDDPDRTQHRPAVGRLHETRPLSGSDLVGQLRPIRPWNDGHTLTGSAVDGSAAGRSAPPTPAWDSPASEEGILDDTALYGATFNDDPAGDDALEASALDEAVAQDGVGLDLADEAAPMVPLRVRRQRRGPWGRLAERWVPEPLRDSRIDPGRRGALVLTIVAAVAASAAAIGVWRARPEPRPVETVSLSQAANAPANAPRTGFASVVPTGIRISRAPGATPSSGAAAGQRSGAAGAASTEGEIVVSVTGRVLRQGLVRLPTGSRVADAIAAAGGARAGTDVTGLNLAAKLSDGQSVVVGDAVAGGSGPGGAAGPSAGTGGAGGAPSPGVPVNLNTADAATLDALPGVGPVTAAGIVAWRLRNGRFSTVQQLQEIPGIGPAKFAQIAPLVTV